MSVKMGGATVEICELHRFIVDCMVKVGTDPNHAKQLAEVLIAADQRGHYSHGLNRLDMYLNDIRLGITHSNGSPSILSERICTAWVDGNNLLGPVVGNVCMRLAIEKAKKAGVGLVTCKGSNHFGIAGWYSMQAIEEGMLGLSFTNTSPCVYPPRSSEPVLGTNPITLAAPALNNDSFVLDMATSTVAIGKIEMAHRKGEKTIPSGWAVDGHGKETHKPEEVLGGKGGLMPLGGAELTGGYKGYGLSMLVDVLTGVLGGAHSGKNVRKMWEYDNGISDLGQCFIAIDPNAFAPEFEHRMKDLIDTCRALEPTVSTEPVLVAGDPERAHTETCDKLGGIPYHQNQIAHVKQLAHDLGVAEMKVTDCR